MDHANALVARKKLVDVFLSLLDKTSKHYASEGPIIPPPLRLDVELPRRIDLSPRIPPRGPHPAIRCDLERLRSPVSLPAAKTRFAGQVILAHTDVGSFEKAHNLAMAELMSANLHHVLAPGAFVLSDLPLNVKGTKQMPLPEGARVDRYYMYQAG